MTTLYIAGPMTGLPENNYPAFFAAEEQLIAAGYTVHNPAISSDHSAAPRPHVELDPKWGDFMRNGINQLIRADGICLLDGWEKSRGARLEKTIAEQLEMHVYEWYFWLSAPSMQPSPLDPGYADLVHIEPSA